MNTKCLTPKSMTELLCALNDMTPESKLLAGGTDLIINMHSELSYPDVLLYLGGVEELTQINEINGTLEIGAAVTMRQMADNPIINKHFPALSQAAGGVGSPQIRNSATIGGNVGTASPAGDMLPVLYLYNALVTIVSGGRLYTKAINEIVLKSHKTCLAHNEAIVKFTLPLPTQINYRSGFMKLGYRKTVSISRIGLAVSGCVQDGKIFSPVIIAAAISDTPLRIVKAEEYLDGKAVDDDVVEKIGSFISEHIKSRTRKYKVAAAKGIVEDVLKKLISD